MSDREHYVLPSSAEEIRRLERQAQLYGGMSFLEPFLDAAPRRVLDLGCGTGHFAAQVARRLPNAEVLGVDADGARLAFAADASQGVDGGRLRFERADIRALPFADASFDLAYARFVLLFQPAPVAALREVRRVLRPGGRAVLLDMVHDGVWFSPPAPAFQQLLVRLVAFLRERGLEPNQGLHLGGALRRAGFTDVGVRPMPWLSERGEDDFEGYRDNWRESIRFIVESGVSLDSPLVTKAQQELCSAESEQLLEISVLACGVVS